VVVRIAVGEEGGLLTLQLVACVGDALGPVEIVESGERVFGDRHRSVEISIAPERFIGECRGQLCNVQRCLDAGGQPADEAVAVVLEPAGLVDEQQDDAGVEPRAGVPCHLGQLLGEDEVTHL
jgi:hypothetical protein